MSQVALLVRVTAVPGQRQALLARLSRHARTCLEAEPGCLRFDVLTTEEVAEGEDSEQILIYEVYTDDAALAAHRESAHMAAFQADATPMMATRSRTLCKVIDTG